MVKADLQVVVDLEPNNLDFGTVTRGADATRVIKMFGEESAKTNVVSVSIERLGARRTDPPTAPPVILAEAKELQGTKVVELSVAPDAPAGPFFGQLVVVTDNPKATHLTARVRANVEASVVAKPPRLSFSIPEGGGEQTQEIVVHSTDGKPVEVLGVSSEHPCLSATFVQLNERRTKVTVTCSGETRAERELTGLMVRTTSEKDPELEVPVGIYRLKRTTAQPLPAQP